MDTTGTSNPDLTYVPICTSCPRSLSAENDKRNGKWLKMCQHCRDIANRSKIKRRRINPQASRSAARRGENLDASRRDSPRPQQNEPQVVYAPVGRNGAGNDGAAAFWVWTHMKYRLERNNVQIGSVQKSQYQFLLPTGDNPNEDLWQKLVTTPLVVTPIELGTIIRLDHSLHRTKRVLSQGDTESTVFYLRTFCLTVRQFLQIWNLMFPGIDFLESTSRWIKQITALGPEDTIYLRYVGQTSSCPIRRHVHDAHASASSFLSRFLTTTRTFLPEVITTAIVQEFLFATISEQVSHRIADEREQMIIALFWDGTLNMDVGGKCHVMIGEDDLRIFSLLGTETTALLSQTTSQSAEKASLVHDYAVAVQSYANAHKRSTGLRNDEFPEPRCEIIFRQGIPRSLNTRGHAPLLTVGYDVCPNNFRRYSSYFLSPGRGPNAAATILAHFAAWETSGDLSATLETDTIPQLVQDNCLPFVDIYPWPHVSYHDKEAALQLLRQGIHAVDPLVIVTYGGQTSRVALGDFGHTSLSRAQFNNQSRPGSLHLRNFDAQAGREQDCDWAVIIHSNDPGSIYYSSHVRPAATRLFCLTTAVAWSAASEAMKLSQQNPACCKRDLCVLIKCRMESLVGPGTPFGQHLQRAIETCDQKWVEARQQGVSSAKYQLARGWDLQGRGYSSVLADDVNRILVANGKVELQQGQRQTPFDIGQLESVQFLLSGFNYPLRMRPKKARWDAAGYELRWLITCGMTEGNPGSSERHRQAEALLDTLLGSYHFVEPADLAAKREAFVQWAIDLPEDKSYFACAYNIDQVTAQIPNLLCCVLSRENQEDPEIIEDKDAMCKAWKRLYGWIMSRDSPLTIETAIRDLSSLANMDVSEEAEPSEPENGYRVILIPEEHNHSDLVTRTSVYWQDEFGCGHAFNHFTFPKDAVPEDLDDERYLVFTINGIDIRDAFGNTLGIHANSLTLSLPLATVPAHQLVRILANNPRGMFFENLWSRKVGKRLENVMTDVIGLREALAIPTRSPEQEIIRGHAMVFPKSFFESGNQNALIRISYYMRGKHHLPRVLELLPAHPGDELWLLDQFFTKCYPDGGTVDTIHAPLAGSVWTKLRVFAGSPEYVHHPHIRTIRALAESGLSGGKESGTATSQLSLAIFALFGEAGYTETRKTYRFYEEGRKRDSTRKTFKIGRGRRPGAIAPTPIPQLVPFNIDDEARISAEEQDPALDPDDPGEGPSGA